MKSTLKMLVLFVLLCGCGSPPGFPDNEGTEQVSFYRLRFELSTTSTAVEVTLEDIQNVLTARQMEALNNPERARVGMRSLAVAPVSSGQLVAVSGDYAITPDALGEPFPCLLKQYPDGESTVRVYNVSASGGPVLLKEVSHTGSEPLPFSVDLSSLQGTPPFQVDLPTFGLERMMLAFYYPWYDMEDWSSNLLEDKPEILYSSDDRVAIERHIDQAQSAGIGGFISSWWGPGDYTDQNLASLLDIAETKNFQVSVYFETLVNEQYPLDEATIVSRLIYVISNYGDHPAFLKVDGKPVIVVFASNAVDPATWQRIFARVGAQAGPAIYIADMAPGQDPNLGILEVFDGRHSYTILGVVQSNDQLPKLDEAYATTGRGVRYYPLLMDSPEPKIWAATIQPGYYDNCPSTPILSRENGNLYRGTFQAARKSNPHWIFITTWNEWWENTYIEPSVEFGDQYLMLTREFAEQWGITNSSEAFLPIILSDLGQ